MLSVWEGALIAVVFVLGSFAATAGLGAIMDTFVDLAADTMVEYNISEEWNTLDTCMVFVTDLHLLLILMPIVGILIFVISVVARTKYDKYGGSEMYSEEEYEQW